MTDLPNSPHLDLPIRTLREVEEQRWKATQELAAAYDDAAVQADAAAKRAATIRNAYYDAYDAWLDARREASRAAAAQRAA